MYHGLLKWKVKITGDCFQLSPDSLLCFGETVASTWQRTFVQTSEFCPNLAKKNNSEWSNFSSAYAKNMAIFLQFTTRFPWIIKVILALCTSFKSRGSLCNVTGFPFETFPFQLWHNGTQQHRVPRGTRTRDPADEFGFNAARFAFSTRTTNSSFIPATLSP